MAFWNRDDESEWEEYQKSRGKKGQEPEDEKTPPVSEEFHEYFKTARQAQSPESGEAEQPGEKNSPLQTFLSRFRGEKPKEPEGPPEKCPWCGGDMVKGYLRGGRDSVYWSDEKPGFLRGFNTVQVADEGGLFSNDYKVCWFCKNCRKIFFDTANLDPPLGDTPIPEALLNSMSTEDRAAYEPDAAADPPAGEPEAHNQET